ncbi:MAG TPA: CBS domain-containing protein [Pseudomonadales bacterium]|nr:CBS domain-containing protein [Pseudomonadales bacterium]
MLLKDVCVLDVVCCGRRTGIVEAARLMRTHHTGDLIVVDDPDDARAPAGIVTDRDIVVEVLGGGRDIASTTVGDVMKPHVVIAHESEDTAVAVERMHLHGVRRIPVVDRHGSLVGVFTLDDALKLHAERAKELVEIVEKEQTRERRTRR